MHPALLLIRKLLKPATLALLLVLPLAFVAPALSLPTEPPHIRLGTMDLSDWNFVKDGTIELNGEWALYWRQLLKPADFTASAPAPNTYLNVPSDWESMEINGERLGADGFATLRLTVILPPQEHHYALRLAEIPSSYRLWLNNEKIAVSGLVGTGKATETPRMSIEIVSFTAAGQIDLTMQLSNHYLRSGGLPQPVRFGLAADLQHQQRLNQGIALLIIGSLLMMGLYHLLLYLLRHREKASLLLGIYCLLWATNAITSATNDYFIYTLLPDFPFLWFLRIEMLAYIVSVPVIFSYFFALYPEEGAGWLLRTFQGLALIFALITMAGESHSMLKAITIYHLLTVGMIFYIYLMIIRAVRRQCNDATLALVGTLLLTFSGFNDMLRELQLIQTPYLVPLGLLLFIGCQACVLAKRFSRALDDTEQLNVELENNLRLRRELEHRKETELELQRGQRRLSELLDGVDTALLAINDSEEICFCNRTTEKLLAKTAAELLGASIWELSTEEDRDALRQMLSRLASPADAEPCRVNVIRDNSGDLLPVEITITRLELDDERLTMLILSAADDSTLPSAIPALPMIAELDRNRGRLQALEDSLNGLLPKITEQVPDFIEKMQAIEQALEQVSLLLRTENPATDSHADNIKARCGVKLLHLCLQYWQEQTGHSKFELARRCGLWKVYTNRDGWERAQTMDRYLALDSLPRNPRWKLFAATADFVLAAYQQSTTTRQQLEMAQTEFHRLP